MFWTLRSYVTVFPATTVAGVGPLVIVTVPTAAAADAAIAATASALTTRAAALPVRRLARLVRNMDRGTSWSKGLVAETIPQL